MNMDLDACPLPCRSSPGTPQRHVIHAQFQALWNPNSFTKGRSRPQTHAIMSSFDLSQGPRVSGSLYHLQLQDLNSIATTLLRFWEAFHSCQVMALEQQTSMGLPPHRKGVLPPGRVALKPSCPSRRLTRTLAHGGNDPLPVPDLPASSRKPTTSWLRSWHKLWPWSRL